MLSGSNYAEMRRDIRERTGAKNGNGRHKVYYRTALSNTVALATNGF